VLDADLHVEFAKAPQMRDRGGTAGGRQSQVGHTPLLPLPGREATLQ
jgi:hypothetical protein